MAFSLVCRLYLLWLLSPPFCPSCPLFADSPSPPPIIISSTFVSYVSCCFSGLRFRSARSPMAGEELQPHGRTLTQEAEGPGTVQSPVPGWLEEERARGARVLCVLDVLLLSFPLSLSASCSPPFWTLYYLYQIGIAGRVPTRQLKGFATFIF